MRIPLLVFALAAAIVSTGRLAAAQPDDFQWSGTVARGKKVEIRGVHGSILAISSEDDLVHVDARRSDPAGGRIEVVEHDQGVTVYAARVDFVVRVPTGVHFAGSMIKGDIDVERLRSEATVTTISGNVNMRTAGFAAQVTAIDGNVLLDLPTVANAELYADTVSGTIDFDVPVASSVPSPPQAPLLPDGSRVLPSVPRPAQIVHATIGNGGPELRVTTVKGSIRLRRR
jgi:hypothetical protein